MSGRGTGSPGTWTVAASVLYKNTYTIKYFTTLQILSNLAVLRQDQLLLRPTHPGVEAHTLIYLKSNQYKLNHRS